MHRVRMLLKKLNSSTEGCYALVNMRIGQRVIRFVLKTLKYVLIAILVAPAIALAVKFEKKIGLENGPFSLLTKPIVASIEARMNEIQYNDCTIGSFEKN